MFQEILKEQESLKTLGTMKVHVCWNYIKEVEWVISKEKLNDVDVKSLKPDCIVRSYNPSETLELAFNDNDETAVNVCPNKRAYSAINGDMAFVLCQSNLLNKELIDFYVSKKFFIISPGWLTNWKYYIMDVWGFNKETAREFFKEATDSLLLLDCGIYEGVEGMIMDLSNFLNIPFEILPVGMDHFKNQMLLQYNNWKQQKINEERIQRNKKVADYAIVYDFTERLSVETDENELIMQILDICVLITGAKELSYISTGNIADRYIKYLSLIHI